MGADVIVVICQFCNKPLQRSETLVPGSITLYCRPCAVFRIEGIDQWVSGGYGLSERLAATLPVVEKQKANFDPATIEWTKPGWEA
jgi:hypothetical protein